MRTRIVTFMSTVTYPFTEAKSPIEIVQELLINHFKSVPYEHGKVVEVISVDIDTMGDLEIFDTGLDLSFEYIAKLKVLYFNEGDVLFNATIQDIDEELGTHQVKSVNSALPIIIRTRSDIARANVIITGFYTSTNPTYTADFAIFPNYHPIIAGRERIRTTELETRFYDVDITPRRPTKKELSYLDPLSTFTIAKRRERIVSDIRQFMNIQSTPAIAGLEALLKNKKPKKIATVPANKTIIEFANIDTIQALALSRQTANNQVELVFVPSIPLFSFTAAVVTTPSGSASAASAASAASDHLSEVSIQNFIIRVSDYINMKITEHRSLSNILTRGSNKALSKLYKDEAERIRQR